MLTLTPAEAKNFWPAYDAYQRTLDMTNREKNVTIMGVIGQDKPVSDLYAKQIAKDIMRRRRDGGQGPPHALQPRDEGAAGHQGGALPAARDPRSAPSRPTTTPQAIPLIK